MTRKKPTTLLVFGILNLVFGPLCLFCSMCCGIGMGGTYVTLQQIQQQKIPDEQRELMEGMFRIFADNIPGIYAVLVSMTAAVFLLGIFKIIAGIGMVRIQSWGRWLGAVCGLLIMFITAGWVFYSFAYVEPAGPQVQKEMEEFVKKVEENQRKMGKQPPGPGPMDWGAGADGGNPLMGNVIVSAFFMFLVTAYGFLLFLFMVLPHTGRAIDRYHGKAVGLTRGEQDDYYHDHERQRRPQDEPPEFH